MNELYRVNFKWLNFPSWLQYNTREQILLRSWNIIAYNIIQFVYMRFCISVFLYVVIILFHFCTNWIFTQWQWDENSSPESFFRLSSLRSQAPCSRIRFRSTLKVIREITSVSIDRTVYLILGTFDALRIIARHGEAFLLLWDSKNLGRGKLQIKNKIVRKRKGKCLFQCLSNLKIFRSRRSEPAENSNNLKHSSTDFSYHVRRPTSSYLLSYGLTSDSSVCLPWS